MPDFCQLGVTNAWESEPRIALFCQRTFLAEHLTRNAAGRTVCQGVLIRSKLLDGFVVLPGTLSIPEVKEGVYTFAGHSIIFKIRVCQEK